MRRPIASLLLLVAIVSTPPSATRAAQAAPFVVTTAADSGPGSLRQAILDANARPGADEIHFAIPGSAPLTISLSTPPPQITDPVTIDGTTQPGYAGRPIVELVGPGEGDGVALYTDESTVRALVINRFDVGVRIMLGYGNAVEGCYIGTDWTGSTDPGNDRGGIFVELSSSTRIGGVTPGAGNLISGNGGSYRIGGGVYIRGGSGTVIQGNRIGTDATGRSPLRNLGPGVNFDGSSAGVVGGLDPSAGNVIAHNGGPGVYSDFPRTLTVLSNSIYGNGQIVENHNGHYGIHYRLYRTLDVVSLVFVGPENGGTRVEGGMQTYENLVGKPFVVQFFRNPGCDETGFGQGAEYVATTEATPDVNGVLLFSHLLPIALGAGESITATVTSPFGETTLFSNCLADTRGCVLPLVTRPMRRVSVPAGQSVTLSVEAIGTPPFQYEWYRIEQGTGSVRIEGATSSTYTPPVAQAEGAYRAVVRNGCGEDTFHSSIYVCAAPPRIVAQPEGRTVGAGSFVDLGVSAEEAEAATYQWYQGRSGDTSAPLAATAQFIRTSPLTETTSFWVRVTNGCGSTDSETATITVLPPMEIASVKLASGPGGARKLVAKGRNLDPSIRVFVDGTTFEKAPKVKAKKVVQTGKLRDGRSLEEAFPRGQTVRITFVSAERGSAFFDYTRP